MTDSLTALIDDVRRALVRLKMVGAPDIDNGQIRARAIVTTFDQIEQGYAAWRSKLRGGDLAWSTSPHTERGRLLAALQALVLVGRQIEQLPYTRERQEAMARSQVCRESFGSVKFAQEGGPGGSPVPQ